MLIIEFDLNSVPGVARALYSYQAQSAEELSFQEGALIHLKRCRHGEVCVVMLKSQTRAFVLTEAKTHADFVDFIP